MKLIVIISSVFLATANYIFSQSHPLIISSNINLPKDTLISNRFLNSLNGFLNQKDSANKKNTFVLNEDLLETSVLLDEMKEVEKSGRFKDNNFYKGYLTNITQLDSLTNFIQFSYIGVHEATPILVASFNIISKQKGNQYYFSSPLKRNTSSWKIKTIGNCTFHFKNTLNEKIVSQYFKDIAFFDKKLHASTEKIEWYGCKDLPELLQNIGVAYKLDYNGRSLSTFSARENNSLLLVSGSNNESFNEFDPHDLWHERLHSALPANIINKPVDEGCAYLYGGSWGLSWSHILKRCKEKVASNPKANWLALYDEFYNFGETNQNHLLVTYVINALIIEKLEKEKGFSAVIELLSCGPYQKENENYFKILEKLTGINKTNFNDKVSALIKNS